MLARQRQARILERIQEDGAVRVADLVRELGVSDMTVRRDLELLHAGGLIEKVHGGATAVPGSALFEPGFVTKSALQQAEKEAIAEAAAALVDPGVAVGISAGTTTYAIARRLVDVPGLTVVTNSIRVADVLGDGRNAAQTVILTGGVRTPSEALVGPFAVSVLQTVHLDLVFMGVHGMDLRAGFTSPNFLEAETNRAMVDAARLLVVVADHTKWGVVGLSSFARLDQADILVTDSGLEPSAREILTPQVRQLIIAEPRNSVATRPPTASDRIEGGRPDGVDPAADDVRLVAEVVGPAAIGTGAFAPRGGAAR